MKNEFAADGSIAAEFDYGPYGRVMHRSGPQVANLSLRYQTKYHDVETNSYYYGIRHYDPATCRWLSRDPLEEQGGYNLYAFVNNDPINNVDYLGLAIEYSDPIEIGKWGYIHIYDTGAWWDFWTSTKFLTSIRYRIDHRRSYQIFYIKEEIKKALSVFPWIGSYEFVLLQTYSLLLRFK